MPGDDAANLQSKRTAKETARRLGISERQLHKAGEILRYRPDLFDKVLAKEISIHAAWLESTGREKDTSWIRLVRAWNNASDEDRARFMDELGFTGAAERIREQIPICLPDGTANLRSDE